MTMQQYIPSLGLQEMMKLLGFAAAGIVFIVQGLSKKYKPWTWLLRQLGKALNADVTEKVTRITSEMECLRKDHKKLEEETAEKRAVDARRRILRFSDECRRKDKHSQEHFNDIFLDIKHYKEFCDSHPHFENDKAGISIDRVERAYRYALDNDDFL